MTRLILSGILEMTGVGAIVWGFSLISPFLGLIIGGIALIVVGMAIDPPKRREKPEVKQ